MFFLFLLFSFLSVLLVVAANSQMPDNGIFCVLLVFWNAQRDRRGEGERGSIAQNQFARNIFHDFLFYMLICLYMHIIYTSQSETLSIALHRSSREWEREAMAKEAFCFFTYIGVIAFHVLKRSRVSIMHMRRKRESTHRIAAACRLYKCYANAM